ncbi:uncharacterized protein LOC113316775 [Papaver somniferum]|uniref:uncharacterized protein LOC113316775 n=1 Tax=Papaver somniferum TaxID=3469 RepID=UPI000E7012CF|nr:uncharacterized protein LOC113316775 [Papaver somniferum]
MVGVKACSSHACATSKLSPGDSAFLDNATEYRSLVGSLQYLTWTSHEICYVVNQGTIDHGILFTKAMQDLQGFSDADWAGDPTDRWSTSGFCILFGEHPVTWSCKKHPRVARSSTEAEYRSLA